MISNHFGIMLSFSSTLMRLGDFDRIFLHDIPGSDETNIFFLFFCKADNDVSIGSGIDVPRQRFPRYKHDSYRIHDACFFLSAGSSLQWVFKFRVRSLVGILNCIVCSRETNDFPLWISMVSLIEIQSLSGLRIFVPSTSANIVANCIAHPQCNLYRHCFSSDSLESGVLHTL